MTASKLLEASTRVRRLYTKYPTTALPFIIAELPAPMCALFQLSWDLDNTQTDNFDYAAVLDLLQTIELIEYSGELGSPQPLIADPLEALHTVVDFYMEVHDAAELYGQCMADGISKFLDPTVHTPPIVLSDTEHMRIACALWLTKIHHQLLLKLTVGESAETYPFNITDAIVANLQPWQLDQVLSLERKLQEGIYPHQNTLEYAGQVDPRLVERLLSTSYIERYSAALCRSHFRFFHVVIDSVSRRQQTNALPLPVERYKSLSVHLGLSFFDASRLAQWRINSAADVLTYADDAYQRELACLDACETSSSRHARREEIQVVEWTRCPESMTSQEWQKGKSIEK